MTIPTATSVAAIAAEKLREMFLESATMKAAGGGVYFGATPKLEDQAAYPRPFFIIGLTEDFRYHMIAGGSQNQLRPSGTLAFFGIRNTPSAYITGGDCDYSAADIDHMNFFGAVLDDVADMAGLDDNLIVTDIVNRDFAEVDAKYWDQLGRFYFCSGLVHWGDSSPMGRAF